MAETGLVAVALMVAVETIVLAVVLSAPAVVVVAETAPLEAVLGAALEVEAVAAAVALEEVLDGTLGVGSGTPVEVAPLVTEVICVVGATVEAVLGAGVVDTAPGVDVDVVLAVVVVLPVLVVASVDVTLGPTEDVVGVVVGVVVEAALADEVVSTGGVTKISQN